MNNEFFQAISAEMITMSEADLAMRKSEVWDASNSCRLSPFRQVDIKRDYQRLLHAAT